MPMGLQDDDRHEGLIAYYSFLSILIMIVFESSIANQIVIWFISAEALRSIVDRRSSRSRSSTLSKAH